MLILIPPTVAMGQIIITRLRLHRQTLRAVIIITTTDIIIQPQLRQQQLERQRPRLDRRMATITLSISETVQL